MDCEPRIHRTDRPSASKGADSCSLTCQLSTPGCFAATTRVAATRVASVSTMANDSSIPVGQFVIYQQRMHGDVFEDAEDWLDLYECVTRFNGWEQERKLYNMYFALNNYAKTWLENHKTEVSNWDEFRCMFMSTYTRCDRRGKAALHTRNQRSNESVAMYYEDMPRLFKRADRSMTEEKKLRQLMQGAKQEQSARLVRNLACTVTEFIAVAATMDRTLEHMPRQYDCNQNCTSADVLSAASWKVILSVVPEKLRLSELPRASLSCASLAQAVQEKVRQAIQEPPELDLQPPSHSSVTYAQALRQAAKCAATNVTAITPTTYATPRNVAAIPRQPRNRCIPLTAEAQKGPLCDHCGKAGHVYRADAYHRGNLCSSHLDAPCPQNGE